MNVAVVIVTYQPSVEVLSENLRGLVPRAARVVVYDNSDAPAAAAEVRSLCGERGAVYLGGTGNVGIAAAQNAAVATLGSDDVANVMFLDQDSHAPGELVDRLSESFQELRRLDPRAGILGAMPVNDEGRPYGTRELGTLGPYLKVDFVISSGSIMSLTDLRAAGGLRGDLFIDLVDCELSWRMQRSGQASYVDTRTPFRHRVGTGRLVSAFGMQSPVSAPFRNYYQTRNLILLGRSGVLPWGAVCARLCNRLGAILLSAARHGQPWDRVRFTAKGLLHGVRGRGGQLASPRAGR
jgi:rhamnosyltransferase